MNLVELYLNYIQDSKKKPISEFMLTALAAMSVWNFYMRIQKAYSDHISQVSKYCKNFVGIDNKMCIMKQEIKITEDMLNQTKAYLTKCQDNEKCQAKIQKKIVLYQEKLDSLHERMKLSLDMAKGQY